MSNHLSDVAHRAAELDQQAQQKLRLARQLRAEGYVATAEWLRVEAALLAEKSLDYFHAIYLGRLAQ